jgi:hypothetical protein
MRDWLGVAAVVVECVVYGDGEGGGSGGGGGGGDDDDGGGGVGSGRRRGGGRVRRGSREACKRVMNQSPGRLCCLGSHLSSELNHSRLSLGSHVVALSELRLELCSAHLLRGRNSCQPLELGSVALAQRIEL